MSDADPIDHARLLVARGENEAARAAVDRVLQGRPNHVPALLFKATLLLEERCGEEALSLLERAVALEPRSAETVNALARCLHALGRNTEALARAEEARLLLGDEANRTQTGPVYLTLVWCLRELRRHREALAAAEEGLALFPDAILAHWAEVVEEELAETEKERC